MRKYLWVALALLFVGMAALPELAAAQSINIDAGDGGGGSSTARMIQLILLITVLSLAPSILVMTTSFMRIIIVLSFVRMAIGTQNTPPNQVMVALALFLTLFIMAPTFQKSYDEGIRPLINEEITEEQALPLAAAPFHTFMLEHVREKDLRLFMDMQETKVETPADTPFQVLIPAFMISELKRAFEIGFLIFIPFLIIDMVVASILMAMGMMMLPPVVISLPFKIVFFVLVDGWYMLAGSLVRSFGAGGS
ncbi:MAG: flagellar biosynthetic protein FliP [Azospirillum brasilense]|nr:MAG: flagellar biosynthetic protein FliP [Azospirillum brasilense]